MSQCKPAGCFTELVNLTSYGCHNRYVYYKPLSNKCSIPMKEISESNLFSLVGEMFRQYHNTIYCNRFGTLAVWCTVKLCQGRAKCFQHVATSDGTNKHWK